MRAPGPEMVIAAGAPPSVDGEMIDSAAHAPHNTTALVSATVSSNVPRPSAMTSPAPARAIASAIEPKGLAIEPLPAEAPARTYQMVPGGRSFAQSPAGQAVPILEHAASPA